MDIKRDREGENGRPTAASDPARWSRNVLDHALEHRLSRVQEVPGPSSLLDEERAAEQPPLVSHSRTFGVRRAGQDHLGAQACDSGSAGEGRSQPCRPRLP
jgi:hypothetical protein